MPSAAETNAIEENMKLDSCPLTFIQEDDRFYLERQNNLLNVEGYNPKKDIKNTQPIEIKDGYTVKLDEGKEFQATIKDKTLSITELSYPTSISEDLKKGIFTYNIDGVQVTVTAADNGQSTVSFGGKSETYKYLETPAIEITPGYSIRLTSTHEGPTRIILHKKMLTNLNNQP